MPVSHIPSAEGKKSQKASYKRRKDQNTEIGELESMLPWSQKGSGIDKISVLRLTTAFMKFKEFWQSTNDTGTKAIAGNGFDKLFSEALDGFILVLSAAGDVLYVSEGVADYIGITQQDVIGQSIYELADADDANTIKTNLIPKGMRLQQHRQFYVRFKSSISPGKKPLSRFSGTIMVQVSGHLKLSRGYPDIKHTKVLGLVAECRLIEASCSILEISIPQTSFTSTTTMDLKILSVDTKMSTITGFTSNIEGAILTDFFHPSDNRRSIHCLKLLLITGESTSPIIRFMTHTGEWVWVQISGLVRYEPDNRTAKFLEATFKVVCSGNDGTIKMIEQRERYGRVTNKSEDAGIHADPRFDFPSSTIPNGSEEVVKAIEKTNISSAVRDVMLHSREEALSSLPFNMDRLAEWENVVDAVVEYETSKGLEPNYKAPYPPAPPKVNEKLLVKSPSSLVTGSPSTLSSASSKPTSPDLIQASPPNPNASPSPNMQQINTYSPTVPQGGIAVHPQTGINAPHQPYTTATYPQTGTTATSNTYDSQSSIPQMVQPTYGLQPMATSVPQQMVTNVSQPMVDGFHQPMVTNVPMSNGTPMYNGSAMHKVTPMYQSTSNQLSNNSPLMMPQPMSSPGTSIGSPADSPMYHSPDGQCNGGYNTVFSPPQQQMPQQQMPPQPITVNVNVSVQPPPSYPAMNHGVLPYNGMTQYLPPNNSMSQGMAPNNGMNQYLPSNNGYSSMGYGTYAQGVPNNSQYNNGQNPGIVFPTHGCGQSMDKGQMMYNNISKPGDNILETLQLI